MGGACETPISLFLEALMSALLRTISILSVVLVAACSNTAGEAAPTGKCGPDTTPCTAPPYADSEWTSIHATSRNNDYVETTIAQRYEKKWKVLEGVATVMGPSIGPEGNLYISAPSLKGTSALYAFNSDGDELWKSEPWNGPEDLDSCAGYQTPIIDTEGDVYVGDCNQLWSFTADGTLRWAVDLPDPPAGAAWQTIDAAPVNSFVTGFFSKDGSVGGITIWGDIVLVSRTDGSSVAPAMKMPGSVSVSDDELPEGLGIEPPPGLWQPDFMDQDMISPIWYVFDGVTPGANTPAVEPNSGRIFATGFSEALDDDLGALYGFDFEPGEPGELGTIEVGLTFVMGPGSGSSPGITADGSTVYVSDGEGMLYSVDAKTGEENWSTQTGGQPASPSVGPDGKIYLLGGNAGSSYNPDGSEAWVANLDAIAETLVPPLDPDSILTGPTTFNNAIPTITDSGILTTVTVGYEFFLGRQAPVPVMQIVILLDADTGEPVEGHEFFEVDDTVDGFVIPSLEGTIYVNQGALASSTISTVSMLFEGDLPDGVTVMQPIGGLQAYTPAP